MRLLFLSNLYPPHDLGGYEQWCQEVTECMRERGHAIKILTSRFRKQSWTASNANDIVRSLYLENNLYYYKPLDFFFKRWFYERKNRLELQRIIDQFEPDFIIVWGMWNLSQNLAYWAEKYMPDRVVYYLASYWPVDLDPHRSYWHLQARHPITEFAKRPLRALACYLLDREHYPPRLAFRHSLCCSNFVRKQLVEAGILTASAGVLYGGVPPEPFVPNCGVSTNSNGKSLHLLYFGRLVHDKGVHTAIEAVGQLKQHGLADKFDLTIIGDGHPEYHRQLRQLVRQLDVDEQIQFMGQFPRAEIPKILSNFDVFLFTSIWPEPFGRTIVEAMLAGLVVIGSDVGGSREIFNYYDRDLMFQAGDYQSLADRIIRIMDNPQLRLRLKKMGQRIALERFTLSRMVEGLEGYLFSILQNSNS